MIEELHNENSKELHNENKSAYVNLINIYNPQNGGAKNGKTKNKEIEYRFYNVDVELMRKILKKLGGELIQKKILMPLVVFNHPLGKNDSYIRIRHEGYRITMTSKTDLGNRFVTEYEVSIDSFEQGVKLLLSLGCTKKYYVEKLREIWSFKDTEIVFDSYPGTKEYIEIEADTEKAIKNVIKILKLPAKSDKSSDRYNDEYGAPKNRKIEGDLTIDNAIEKFSGIITKNKETFLKIIKEQKKYYKNSDARSVKKALDNIV